MLINCVILLVLSIKITFSSSSSFKDEEKKIMKKYDELGSNSNGAFSHSSILLPLESILSLDSIVFLREMRMVVDDLFLIAFWFTFQSRWFFFYDKNFPYNAGKGVLAEIAKILLFK